MNLGEMGVRDQNRQYICCTGQAGDLQIKTIELGPVVFMGPFRCPKGDAFQKYFISGLRCHCCPPLGCDVVSYERNERDRPLATGKNGGYSMG